MEAWQCGQLHLASFRPTPSGFLPPPLHSVMVAPPAWCMRALRLCISLGQPEHCAPTVAHACAPEYPVSLSTCSSSSVCYTAYQGRKLCFAPLPCTGLAWACCPPCAYWHCAACFFAICPLCGRGVTTAALQFLFFLLLTWGGHVPLRSCILCRRIRCIAPGRGAAWPRRSDLCWLVAGAVVRGHYGRISFDHRLPLAVRVLLL